MKRQFVPFDDSYRVPVDVRVSRGVVTGEQLFICGQMDLDAEGRVRNAGDLWAQTDTAMRLLYDVVGHAGFEPEDIIQLHVFYRAPTDEASYLERILGAFPECGQALTVLTPVGSYPSPGVEVEIDAIAVRGGQHETAKDTSHRIIGRRQGNWLVAQNTALPGEPLSTQIAHIHEDFETTVDRLGAGMKDICKVSAYFAPDVSETELAAAERALALGFASANPTYHGVVLPAFMSDGETVRVEIVALAGDTERQRVQIPWRWPAPVCYSQGMRCGDVVFVGAQLPVSLDAKLMHKNDLAAQTHLAMSHMGDVLAALDVGFEHMTKVNAFFTAEQDLEQWLVNVGIRCGYYVKPGPASTGIETRALSVSGAMISVDCMAVAEKTAQKDNS